MSGQFHSRLSAFVSDMGDSPDAKPIDLDLMNGFTWLLKEVANETVDVFAKTLALFREDMTSFNKLKALLSCFFTFEQATNPLDRRYSDLLTYFLLPRMGALAELPEALASFCGTTIHSFEGRFTTSWQDFRIQQTMPYSGMS